MSTLVGMLLSLAPLAAPSCAPAGAALAPGEPQVAFEAPEVHVKGAKAWVVVLTLKAPAEGASIEGWKLTPAGFQKGGEPLAKHAEMPVVELKANEERSVEVDLGAQVRELGDFELGWGALPAVGVRVLEPAAPQLKFADESSVPTAELAKYWAVLETNRGTMVAEFYPDSAPNHVRNFLDLCQTGFYAHTTFHRVIPGFMIQGGDPTGTGTGNGPRMLKAEFNERKHVRGILSMARTPDPNSASCQFFVMHATAPHLDNSYSVFGKLVSGYRALDRIANTKRAAGDRPVAEQVIRAVHVVHAPADPEKWREAATPAAKPGAAPK